MKMDFCKVSLVKIEIFSNKKNFSIFIRLGEDKFVKVYNGEEPDVESLKETLEKYSLKGMEFLYVSRLAYESFVSLIEEDINSNFDKLATSQSASDRIDGLGNILMEVKSLLVNMGMSSGAIFMANKLIHEVIEENKAHENLEALFELFLTKEAYLKNHALLSSFLVCSVLKEMNWKTDNLTQKVVTAALFQNITLETDSQAKIYSKLDPEFEKLDDYEKELVENHPHLGAELIQDQDFASDDTGRLLRNHHVLPLEGAFETRVSAAALPIMECCFNISCYFSDQIMRSKNQKDFSIMAQEMNEVFNVGSFKRALVALLKVMKVS